MVISRRKVLSILGGGVVLAAAGTGYRVTRLPKDAVAPWTAAGTYSEPRMRALSHAILAPNPHNRQPWVVDLGTDDQVALYVDTERLLPHTDPFSRQIVIGLGCFLEVMRMAAAEDGFAVTFDLFPDGMPGDTLDDRPVAVARFGPGGQGDPLFAQVPFRRSLKEPFDTTRPVASDRLSAILSAAQVTRVGGSVAEDDIAFWRGFSREALQIEIDTPRTYKESVDLFRIGVREIEANPDGIDFSGPMFETMAVTGLFTRESALDRSSMAFVEGNKAVFATTDTAMGHLWQITQSNTRIDQIAAGRDWVRLNLAATALGVDMQPLSQALQEYPEMAEHYDRIHERLAPDGGTVQMFARIGYGPEVPVSPRWPLEAKLLNA